MLQAILNIFKIAELRNKLAFTFGMLIIYRIGFWIPLPGMNQEEILSFAEKQTGAVGDVMAYMMIFTGGSLSQSTIFGLGIMPYISAAIIMQLMTTMVPTLQKLQREGPSGRQKITEWTRYMTVGLCLVQALVLVKWYTASNFVYPMWEGSFLFVLCAVTSLTAGTIFLMWLGEQIDKYGLGNGVSLIITAGIVAQMDDAIFIIAKGFSLGAGDATNKYTFATVLFLAGMFIFVVAGAILITQGQRRIPIQQAKHTRGRRVYGGQRTFLPLRVNHGGVMPIIFASSLMIFPSVLLGWVEGSLRQHADAGGFMEALYDVSGFLLANLTFTSGGYLYILAYIGLIYFFAYFWTNVQFQPKEMATQLRDNGSFIPGLRPGPRTAEYLDTVMERITYVGAGFLAVIAVIPNIVAGMFKVDFMVSQFLGGTGLLICVSVMLDFVTRIESNLLMRNYPGFLSGEGGKGPRMRSPRTA